ncbi:ATP-dependent DNA ligase [Thiohalocapsa marina]|uniref:Probable DNA ligase n=1 Tax=Thiohalocapsa marina TaxID=424902 RepID=A0A5M8FDW7_9GAMM|nr:ATP-dependent DNA ligase [Thiohalocapsa marina]KAA6181896.1 ATP-dependent DNA ligase [Thiohalocapsa marina]
MTRLIDLANASRALAATRSRAAKVDRLAALLRHCDRDAIAGSETGRNEVGGREIEQVARWLTGEIRPKTTPGSTPGRAGAARLHIGPAQMAATDAVEPAPQPRLTVTDLARRLDALADIRGSGSQTRRAAALAGLFAEATVDEQGFLRRLLLGELRQGALGAQMVEAIARAFDIPLGSVQRARMLRADIGEVARLAQSAGRAGLDALGLTLFQPIQPMLASAADDLADALAQLPEPLLEYKLDGARVQIHKSGRQVRVFSRQGNDVSAAVPELIDQVAALPASELVLDGETLALTQSGRPLPFQTTMRRFGRQQDDPALRQQLPLTVFCFDCLALDGETLIDAPLRTRRAALSETVPATMRTSFIEAANAARASDFLAQALAAGHEGLMAKDPGSTYAAGARGSHWLKLKQSHSLDLVVLAAEWGSGRRRGWLSNLHLGARDGAGGFIMLGKTFKGLTDQLLAWQTEQLLARAVARDDQIVHVRPELVVEIAFNELQQSRHYPGGLALRFARVKRYRPDKGPAEADDIHGVRALFERQVAYQPEPAHD